MLLRAQSLSLTTRRVKRCVQQQMPTRARVLERFERATVPCSAT
jgi:hypothetical protein